MLRRLDQIAAALVSLIGVAHLVAGQQAFLAPTERGVWFVSAGFLLVTTGLANLACSSTARTGRLHNLAGLSGALAILILGGLSVMADRDLLFAPQTLVLLALGGFLSVRRLAGLFTSRRS